MCQRYPHTLRENPGGFMNQAFKSFSMSCLVISLIITLVGCLGTDPASSSTSGNSSSDESSQANDSSVQGGSSEESSSSEDEGSSGDDSSSSEDVSSSEVESSEGQSSSEEQSSVESSFEIVGSSSSEVVFSSTVSSSSESSQGSNVGPLNPDDHPKYDGFELVIFDDFNELDLDFWEKSDGSWNDNMCRFVDDGVAVEDGKLKLIMTKERTENDLLWAQRSLSNQSGEYQDPYYDGPLAWKDWSAGELRSMKQYKYGRFETTIKAPNADHYLSTFFLFNVPRDDQWLEIDFELMSGHPGKPTSNLLINKGEPAAWKWDMIEHNGLITSHPEVAINHQEVNEFAIEWTSNYIAWFVNGDEIRRITDTSLIPEKALHIVFNFWLSEAAKYSQTPETTLSGLHPEDYLTDQKIETEYKYFRYYKWDGEENYEHPAWCGNKTWNGTRCQ